ncbi:MAG: NrfD/PsrC family molybdoenzyme membrane anchor subunit [Solirubrobacteraceae bacterium]
MSAPRSYYGQPVIKEPVWTPEIPWYFFAGGLAGASAGLAYLADRTGNDVLARRAWPAALGGVGVSPLLLISDLGVPSRFLNMLRMFKVTSPMSVGSWILAASGAATSVAALHSMTGAFPRLAAVAGPAAAALGLPLSTYTAALIAQTAVPVWHEARHELPVIFAAGAAASAGATAAIATPVAYAGPARRLAVLGSMAELATVPLMEHRLGALADAYQSPDAEPFTRAARLLTATGGLLLAGAARRRRAAAVAGGALVLGGAACERWSVFRAGLVSARDPAYTVAPQRDRVRTGRGLGAIRRAAGTAVRTAAAQARAGG